MIVDRMRLAPRLKRYLDAMILNSRDVDDMKVMEDVGVVRLPCCHLDRSKWKPKVCKVDNLDTEAGHSSKQSSWIFQWRSAPQRTAWKQRNLSCLVESRMDQFGTRAACQLNFLAWVKSESVSLMRPISSPIHDSLPQTTPNTSSQAWYGARFSQKSKKTAKIFVTTLTSQPIGQRKMIRSTKHQLESNMNE